jgi:hypothetical protein
MVGCRQTGFCRVMAMTDIKSKKKTDVWLFAGRIDRFSLCQLGDSGGMTERLSNIWGVCFLLFCYCYMYKG